mgnify:CR=1 FL=1
MATTKKDLALKISERLGVRKQHAYEVVNTLFKAMRESLIAGNRIEIRGFGTFKVVTRASRTGRNPKTGDLVKIPERPVPVFKPSRELRSSVEGG